MKVHLASDWYDHKTFCQAKAWHAASRVLVYLLVTLASGMQGNASYQNFTQFRQVPECNCFQIAVGFGREMCLHLVAG